MTGASKTVGKVSPLKQGGGFPRAAIMVRPLCDKGVGTQASFLRKAFALSKAPEKAELRISALGLYRAFINGARVGDDQLTPGWTCYQDRLSFQTYDVSDLLKQGDNVIDIWLGDGWYRSQMMWAQGTAFNTPLLNTWGSEIGALAEIISDGEVLLATGEGWQSGLLPILKSGIYFGEIYDARLEGLAADKGSAPVTGFDPSVLIPHEINGVKELEPLAVSTSFEDAEGRMIYDFGQNSAGYVSFEAEGAAGARVIVEHSEILDKGVFSNSNMRSAAARLEYVLKGGSPESYRPAFTFQGFRYARVTIEGKAAVKSIVSIPITSAIRRTGSISTGSALVNRLVENTVWSQRTNFIEVPTDCPQRDERLGWTGDAQVFAPTACYLFDSRAFLAKWLRDVMADQRPGGEVPHFSPDPTRPHENKHPGFYGSTGWGDAICVVPWTLWTLYGDKEILAETLPAMIRWVDFVWSISDGPIVRPPRGWSKRGFTFGDWLQPGGPTEKPLPTIGDDAAATIYLHISSVITANVAAVTGDKATEARMRDRAAAVKAAFAQEFITPSGRLAYDDQTSYALAFLHDLIPAEHQEAAKGYFKSTIARADGRIGTGFIGTPALLPALVKIGEPELAAAVFLQEKVPGWLYQVKNGATTIWERWDAIKEDGSIFDPAMNSYNHYAYGAVCQWLIEAVAGFRPDPDRPGFKHVIFQPVIIPSLSPVAASHDSVAGRIEAKWTANGDAVSYEAAVPAGASGTLILSSRYHGIKINGAPVPSAAGKRNAQPARARNAPDHVPDQRTAGLEFPCDACELKQAGALSASNSPREEYEMNFSMTRRLLLAAAAGTALTFAFAAPGFAATTLSISSDGNEETSKALDALTKAFTAANPDVTFELESRPGGAEGDNLVKTRLSTGEMTDIFQYNSGSLFQALNPAQNLADLSDIQGGVLDSYKPVVTSTDGMVRGVPFGAAMGGGIYYNKPIYKELGLSVPKTWAEFMANNEKIKAAGKVAVAQTYKDTWSSQLFVLADFFNVQAAVPTFAADYTGNKAKYATTPAAMKGFDYLEQVFKAGYLNADFGAATFDDGVRMVANGEAAHYPMLTFALGNIKQNFADKVNDVGFFAQPGDDAAKNGLTVWMPAGLYVSSKSANIDAAKKFLTFVASPEGCKLMQGANGATGPYLIKDCGLPADVPPSVADMLPYFQAGLTAPALEFVSPIKGPNLEQLTVEVGSGIRPAAEAAALYDQDVEKQAKQLGLPNW